MTTDDMLVPKQRRSRETLARLLSGAIKVLNEHGLEGATIPRIAAEAGVAPASVYRRFRDRDALFQAAFLDVFERMAAANRSSINIGLFKTPTLSGVARELVNMVIRQYRSHATLTRAFKRFLETNPDEAFQERALAIAADDFETLIELLLYFRSEITHSDPRLAITLGLSSIVAAAESRALLDVAVWNKLLPISDEQFAEELARGFVAYLHS